MNDLERFRNLFIKLTNFKENPFHPLVWINGDPIIGKNVYIGGMSEIYAKEAKVIIGDNCDISSFVSINCADSHKRCIGIAEEIERLDIIIENNVFIGSHCVILGGTIIGHHSVIAAGTVLKKIKIPPYSLVYGNPPKIKKGYWKKYFKRDDSPQ